MALMNAPSTTSAAGPRLFAGLRHEKRDRPTCVCAALLAVSDLSGQPLTLPEAPARITSHDLCRITCALPGPDCPRKLEHFVAGNEPGKTCKGHVGS
jgi:hypothetical protein